MPASSNNSTTTTVFYGHESFETFSDKVSSLFADLKHCTLEDVRRLRGGSWNRIIAARAHWPEYEDSSSTSPASDIASKTDIVFRIPRIPETAKVADQAVIFQFIRQQNICAPKVLALDATSTNAISSPYAVHELIHGTTLHLIYDELPLEEKLSVTTEFVELLAKMESTEFSEPGRLVCASRMNSFTRWSICDNDRWKQSWDVDVVGFRRLSPKPFDSNSNRRSCLSFILGEIDAYIAELIGNPIMACRLHKFRSLRLMCEQLQAEMQSHSFNEWNLMANRNVLHHWDLEPRNIIVQQTGNEWRIVGVLDWDDAESLPAALRRRPPIWLWDSEHNCSSCSQVDTLAPKHYSSLDEDANRIKQHFEETSLHRVMSIESTSSSPSTTQYHDEAYGTGRWLRRFWRFAQHAFRSNEDHKSFDRLEEEWQQHHKRLEGFRDGVS